MLIDYQNKNRQVIENLYKRRLLDRSHVVTYADFATSDEEDVEDMVDPDFYLSVVNDVYGPSISESDISFGNPRIVRCIEKYFSDNPLASGKGFNHYKLAKYLAENMDWLESRLSDTVVRRFQQAFDRINRLLD